MVERRLEVMGLYVMASAAGSSKVSAASDAADGFLTRAGVEARASTATYASETGDSTIVKVPTTFP
jgi:ABC-type hemin transport system substrate-binding protein